MGTTPPPPVLSPTSTSVAPGSTASQPTSVDQSDQAGKCMNAADQKLWKNGAQRSFDSDMTACATKCLGAGGCVASCISEKVGYSSHCAGCVGDLSGCSLANCWWQCMGGKSPSCSDCANSKCEPSFRLLWLGHPSLPTGLLNFKGSGSYFPE